MLSVMLDAVDAADDCGYDCANDDDFCVRPLVPLTFLSQKQIVFVGDIEMHFLAKNEF